MKVLDLHVTFASRNVLFVVYSYFASKFVINYYPVLLPKTPCYTQTACL